MKEAIKRILFDINHPAHVHYFKHVISLLKGEGHEVFVISRNKEIEHELLDKFQIKYISRGKGAKNFISRFFYYPYASFKIYHALKKYRINLFVSFLHPYGVHASKFKGIKSLVFGDTENASLHIKYTLPYATEVHTPKVFKSNLGSNHHTFNGLMELAYLHPNYFKPDIRVLNEVGIQPNTKFVVFRFVSRKSLHDQNHSGLSISDKVFLVNEISKKYKVLISSEIELPNSLKPYELKIEKHRIHDLIFYSSLLIGESATMSAESAVLGTPCIYFDNIGRGYTDYLEKEYNIIRRLNESTESVGIGIDLAEELIKKEHVFSGVRKDILEHKIDTTKYIVKQIKRLLGSN